MKVVVAENYSVFMAWWNESGLPREECYYLAPYATAIDRIPMIESRDDLVYVGNYRVNIDWPKMRKEVLLPMVEKWKEYWKERDE